MHQTRTQMLYTSRQIAFNMADTMSSNKKNWSTLQHIYIDKEIML